MGDTGSSKNNLINHIFETMEYDTDCEKTAQAIEWLKKRENRVYAYIEKKNEVVTGEVLPVKNATNDQHLCNVHMPDAPVIDAILNRVGEAKKAWKDVSPMKRAEIIYKLGNEVQKNQDLFTQIEVVARGILAKDTKNKALPLLTDCLLYYSGFSRKSSEENDLFGPMGEVVAILPDSTALWTLGYVLGPCLAAGHHIILQTGPRLSLAVSLLIELSVQLGVPEDAIRLIPGNVDPNNFFIHSHVSTVAIFDDLYKEQYLFANHFGKKLLHFGPSGASMIVFDNCDLDSACYSVSDAAFGTKGMLPWSVRNIFVQENIFDTFIHKLKHSASSLKVGRSHQKNVDVAIPDNTVLDKIKKIVEDARNQGVEAFQPNDVVPVLLIGDNVFPNNVIKEDFINVPVVTVVSFRNVNEAVTLSNNTRQGLGVSVWTESTSLVNEIIEKLKVGNIWINSHGLFAPNIPMSPYKTSGNAFFGGSEGFYEYVPTKPIKVETVSEIQNQEAMEKAITEAKKAQYSWSKFSVFERTKLLQVAARSLTNKWSTLIDEILNSNSGEKFTKLKNFNIVTTREPRGVIAVETTEGEDDHNNRLIVAALKEGNTVIVLSGDTTELYTQISKCLPKGVFAVVARSQDATKIAALHKELDAYFGDNNNKMFSSLPLKSSSKFKVANSAKWNKIRDKVTVAKNVWLNKGHSFI